MKTENENITLENKADNVSRVGAFVIKFWGDLL
jgi:hypothetical protein